VGKPNLGKERAARETGQPSERERPIEVGKEQKKQYNKKEKKKKPPQRKKK